ncbi:OstA-like protein [Mucilaginibacter sp. KACC 22063]|uniref:OstA-like protein n=1 Tax=Mucilaginibacter sp. KACC 22063 TaxID=3025666 RepID=UPI0023668244|nr:OstA-like protein [Mucilaginibacter sp. KACC 22063]WDF56003.1 OstA-like protein [Mucilaginibacter sp. KACC 22063]
MVKYLFTCLLLFTGLLAFSQQQKKKSVINLVRSDRSQGIKRNGEDVIKVYNGVFKQEFSTLRSDSAYIYPQRNTFEAYGHVNINQGDTLNIYSDKLNYNENTHIAILTDNVKMVDKDATLTTNYLTYNTATRIGTYTGGGKLVNKDNTLTSTNGYYFAFSRDSYFRYNVTLTTVDALIKTDTLRYNTGSRIAYFYGPTHIYGKKKDTLYTENGNYNTITEQAYFGKKNLYTQETKSLKGDSLFYDRLKGFGRAIKNVVFNDNEQKITLHGQIGTFTNADQRAVVTRNPWVTIITEEKDTTKTDTVKKATKDKKEVKNKQQPVLKPAPNTKALTTELKQETPADKPKVATTPVVTAADSAKQQAKTNNKKPALKAKSGDKPLAVKDTAKIKRDTIYMVADTLETRTLTYKELKTLQERVRMLNDTSAAARKALATARALKNPSKFLTAITPKIPSDTSFRHREFFGKPAPKAAPKNTKVAVANGKKTAADSLKRKPTIAKTDSVNLLHTYKLSDTTHVRILIGHYNAKIYKSDLQAKADSIFYSSSDSTIRCFDHPMLWSQGSQMSGDTILLQMKNKKLDNMDIYPSSFIVNTEKDDTTHFNQIAGKKMKGYFADNKLSRMFVSGNAESIYFQRDSLGAVTDMQRSLSSLIRANFKNNELQNLKFSGKPEHRDGPLNKFKEDEQILKGFIWKPHDRPESKEQLIPELDKEHKYKHNISAPKLVPGNTGKGKPVTKPAGNVPASKDSVGTNIKAKPVPAAQDSVGVKVNTKPGSASKDSTAAQSGSKPAVVTPAQKQPATQQNGRRVIQNVIIQPKPSTAPLPEDTTSKKPM